jgi:hypothetical protein
VARGASHRGGDEQVFRPALAACVRFRGSTGKPRPVTVSRWENEREDKCAPSAYQESVLRAFMKACADDPSLKERAAGVLRGLGVAAAMFTILRTAFADANI